MVGVGAPLTDWANDGLFGDGWHLFGIGSSAYEEKAEEYNNAFVAANAYVEIGEDTKIDDLKAYVPEKEKVTTTVVDEETLEETDYTVYYKDAPKEPKEDEWGTSYLDGVEYFDKNGLEEPDPADYGVWVPGIPVIIEKGLDAINCADWLKGLILDGIVAGVGAVLGYVPQMLVLFFLLAFLEASGYMARVAFVLDRIFRRFGLSGKSFIPILIGTGCGIPGIMASRTIENERDRRMTIMTTTFIPCGAKVPFIAMIAGAIFGGSAWISIS